MKCKAAVLFELNNPLQLEELDIPELRPGQVLVEIFFSGICRSQINEINGLKGEDRFLPHTLGHEGSGVVLAVGPDVGKVVAGDRVVLSWIQSSGANVPSVKYKARGSIDINSGAVSTFMDIAVISENRLVKIPDSMPLREAALFGCAIPTGAGMVLHTEPNRALSSLAVFGVGGIGASALLASVCRGIPRIIAIDKEYSKLELAMRLGATEIIDCSKQDALSELSRITEGKGVDLAIESAGEKITMESAFASLSVDGTCILAGNLPHGQKIEIDPMQLIKGKKLQGSWGGGSDLDRDILLFADLYLKGELDLNSMITKEYSLDSINEAISDLEHGKVIRALIKTR